MGRGILSHESEEIAGWFHWQMLVFKANFFNCECVLRETFLDYGVSGAFKRMGLGMTQTDSFALWFGGLGRYDDGNGKWDFHSMGFGSAWGIEKSVASSLLGWTHNGRVTLQDGFCNLCYGIPRRPNCDQWSPCLHLSSSSVRYRERKSVMQAHACSQSLWYGRVPEVIALLALWGPASRAGGKASDSSVTTHRPP